MFDLKTLEKLASVFNPEIAENVGYAINRGDDGKPNGVTITIAVNADRRILSLANVILSMIQDSAKIIGPDRDEIQPESEPEKREEG